VCTRVCGERVIFSCLYSKGLFVFPLIEKGFPRINSFVLCMVILLVILVTKTIVYCIVALFMVQVHAKFKETTCA
jgi:hypothetical protein